MSFDISLESYREIETALVSLTHDGRSHASDVIRLIHNTLRWLYFHAGNPTAKDVVLESMAGLSRAPWSRDDRQWILDMLDTFKERLQYRVVPGDKQSLLELERIMRQRHPQALCAFASGRISAPWTRGMCLQRVLGHFSMERS